MMGILLLTLIYLTGFAESAEPTPSQIKACATLARGDADINRKCRQHSGNFESPQALIDSCARLDPDPYVGIRCLRSGATMEIFKLCRSLNFSLDNTLTCLRSYPTRELVEACQRSGKGEEFLLNCLRSGREPAQVSVCKDLFSSPKERERCWGYDIPHLQARVCGRQKSSEKRFTCLIEEIARAEGEYRIDQRSLRRSLASEPEQR